MGADGHLEYLELSEWKTRWPNLSPTLDCGLKVANFAGVQFVLGYHDSEGRHWEDWADFVLKENQEKVKAALNWFGNVSRTVELWT
jgi:hypothetical protein